MTSDSCREMRAALGAAAIGRIEPAEAVGLRAHLDGCADCRAELRALKSVAAALPLVDVTQLGADLPQPPLELGDLVRSRVARSRAAQRHRLRRRVMLGAAAALVAAAAVAALVLAVPSSGEPSARVVFPMSQGAQGRATLLSRDAGTQVALHASGLHRGDYYWLWITGDDGDRIAAGTFQGTGGSIDVTMTAALPLDEARRIWVTDARNNVVLDTHLSS